MAGKAIVIHDPVSKDEIELTDKESKQYQEILNTAIQLEESHNKVVAEIQEDYKKFLKRNEQHYKKYKELEAELKKGKITTDSFTSIDNLSYNTLQTELIQSQDKITAAESENNLEVTKHKEVLEKFQGTVVHRHRLEKAKVEYNRIKEDIERSKLIVATLKQQIKKPPHNITEVSLAYLQRDLKKYQYHTNLLERRRTRRYKICRKEKPPIEVESDTEYSDGGYSTAEDLKDKEWLPHRYKLTRSVDRVAHPTQPRPQPESEVTKPKEVIEVEPINPTEVIPNPRDLNLPDPLDREVNMDQHRLDERARELIERGEYNHLLEQLNANHRIGQGNGNRDRHDRHYDRNERGLRYSIRDIPIFYGKGDAMPHTHLIEFEDFLANTGSDINDLPQHGEPHEVDRPHYEAVMKDVVNKFKTSLKGKPRLWYEMQYPTSDDEPKTVQAYKKMLSLFTTEHNPIGSTIEQQTMAWKNMKWDPTTERLDDFVYRFRRVAQEIGYNADQQLTFFRCSVPPHLYFYLKDATTITEAMENINRACALGGVSVQGTPAQVETNNTPTVPFMFMNDRQERQPLKTVSFKEESSQDKVNESILKLTQMMERQFQLAEKQENDSRSRSRRRDRRDSRDRRPRSYDRSSYYDRSSSYDGSKSRERSNSRDRSRDRSDRNYRSSRNKSRNQSSRDKRNNSGTRYSSGLYCDHCKMTNHEILNCFKLQNTLKRKGVVLNELKRKSLNELEKHQMIMELKADIDGQDPTN